MGSQNEWGQGEGLSVDDAGVARAGPPWCAERGRDRVPVKMDLVRKGVSLGLLRVILPPKPAGSPYVIAHDWTALPRLIITGGSTHILRTK